MYRLQMEDNSQDGPDGQTYDWTIALFQRESDVQDMKRMLTTKFPRCSFFYYKEDDTIPINPHYVQLCDEIEKDLNKLPFDVEKEFEKYTEGLGDF